MLSKSRPLRIAYASFVGVMLFGLGVAAPGAAASTITVCNHACDHTSIQDAIVAAGTGDTVEIGRNTLGYTWTGQVTVDRNITLEGMAGQTTPTLTLAPPSGSDMTTPTLTFTSAAGGATLRDVDVISDGSGANDAIDFFAAGGHITDVSATGRADAVLTGADGVTISGLSATTTGAEQDSAALGDDDGTVTITGSQFTNLAVGVGIFASGTPTITDSTVAGGNYGIYVVPGSGMTMQRVSVDSPAGTGVLGAGLITDSLVVGGNGAAIDAIGPMQLRNVTAINSGSGNGIVTYPGFEVDLVAKNVIARGASGDSDLDVPDGDLYGHIEVGYSDFTTTSASAVDTTTLGHNLSADPGFVGSGDYHLRNASPLIGAGTIDAEIGTTDLDGKPRPAAGFGQPSIGAYEPTGDALDVTVAGTGAGSVSGTRMDCPGSCGAEYDPGSVVTLTAVPSTGSTFSGWSGACSGAGPCAVTVSATTAVTATFALSAPVSSAPPVIGGNAQVDSMLVATDGTWVGSPTLATAWENCDGNGNACSAIPGATNDTYTVTSGDVGHTIRFTVTATNAAGSSTAQSGPTAVVPAAASQLGISAKTAPPLALTGLRLSPTRFRARQGTHVLGTLSRAAEIQIEVMQVVRGRSTAKGKCKAGNKRGKTCTLTMVKDKLSLSEAAGPDRLPLLVRRLAPGSYTAIVVASADGRSTSPVKLGFRILAPVKKSRRG